MADKATTQTKGAKLMKKRHPEYQAKVGEWDFFVQSYRGGKEYITSNLFKYFKEGDDEFKERTKRAYRENHTKRVVDLINSYLFKKPATRKTKSEQLQAFFENFDGQGTPIDRFMKAASQWSSVLGRVYIVCDKKALPEEERTGTNADNINPKAQPYCYTVFPQNVLDMDFDEDGNLRWALIREYNRDNEDPFKSSGDVKEQFRLWEIGKWTLFNERGEEIEADDTGLDIVPIHWIDNEYDTDYSGQSLIADISYLDRAIFNNWSRLDVIVNDQTFSQLIFPIEGLPPEIVEDEDLREKFLVLATNRILLYSAMAQNQPSFISPDASQAEFILSMIERQVKQLYASMGLQNETGTEVKTESGVAKAYDFDKLNKLLATKGDNLEHAENKIAEIFKKWVNNETIEVEIEYPDDFDVKTLADEIAIAQELAILSVSETFTKEIEKQLVLKALPKAEEATITKIFSEIDQKDLTDDEASKQGNFDFDKKDDDEETGKEKGAGKTSPSKEKAGTS